MYKKRNTAVFIDGENVPAKKAVAIIKAAKKRGVIDTVKVYGLQRDQATQKWSEVASNTEGMKDIRLCGGPARNKVDKKIKKDTIHDVKAAPNVDIVIIVSSDHGYVENIRELRLMGKRVVVIGEAKAPKSLRQSCNEFIQV